MWIQKVPAGGVEGLAFSPDGRTLYAADRSGRVTAWDVLARTPTTLHQLVKSRPWNKHTLQITADGRFVVAGGEWMAVVDTTGAGDHFILPREFNRYSARLDHTRPRVLRLDPHLHQIMSLDLDPRAPGPTFGPWPVVQPPRDFDFSPDGRTLVVIDSSGVLSEWEVETGQELRRVQLMWHTTRPYRVRFSPDGRTLLVFGDGVRPYDVASLSPRGEPATCDLFVLAFHPTLPVFFAPNHRRTATLYSLETGAELRALDFALGQAIQCVAFSPDGLTCAVGGSNKQFAVFDVDV